jgi:acyl carrier protein
MKRRIRNILGDVLGLEADEIGDDLSRETSDQWDSLSHLRIVTAIEQEFGVTLTMDEINGADSFERLVALLAARGRQA